MGSDSAAPVDGELRVRGVQGLRVADASVMPEITRGHTNAPSIVMGEKAADLISTRAREGVRESVNVRRCAIRSHSQRAPAETK